MPAIAENIKLILEQIIEITPNQKLLIVSDTYARSRAIANMVTDTAIAMGVPAALAVFERGGHVGAEPPAVIAAAMKTADVIFEIAENVHISHTTARKDATAAGAMFYGMYTDGSEDALRLPIPFEQLAIVKRRTEKVAEMLTNAKVARVTTPYGTDITMSLESRSGLAIHPLVKTVMAGVPDYAEAAIAPVEGSSEGVVVVDASIRGLGVPPYVMRKPLRFEVKHGKVLVETVSSEDAEQVERLRTALAKDGNAANFAAELGIGTSHIPSPTLRGDFTRDYALAGTFHFATGRNDDIGGQTHSTLHSDMLMTGGSVELDGLYVVKDGALQV